MKHSKPLIGIAAATTLAAGAALPASAAAPAADGNYKFARAVDGDTIQLGNGRYVRLLGYDTPEAGACGYGPAKSKMASLVSGGVKLVNRSGEDPYASLPTRRHGTAATSARSCCATAWRSRATTAATATAGIRSRGSIASSTVTTARSLASRLVV